jgi:AraC family transcriptional regulator
MKSALASLDDQQDRSKQMAEDGQQPSIELLDFSNPIGTDRLSVEKHLSQSDLHIVRGFLAPSDGVLLGATQPSVVVHKGEPFDMEWCPPGSDRLQIRRVEFGDVHINPGTTPFFQRWRERPFILGMALEPALIDRIGEETFGRNSSSLETLIAIRDERLLAAARASRDEIGEAADGSRLVTEHLGVLIAVHLYRNYSDAKWQPRLVKGGLGSARLRQVIDYIEAHLADDLSLAMLASIAGLSLHHFGETFRQSMGVPPHRFVLSRRIERAKILLLSTDMTITQIAFAVGYSSQSHFATKFRQAAGATPQRFRIERRG